MRFESKHLSRRGDTLGPVPMSSQTRFNGISTCHCIGLSCHIHATTSCVAVGTMTERLYSESTTVMSASRPFLLRREGWRPQRFFTNNVRNHRLYLVEAAGIFIGSAIVDTNDKLFPQWWYVALVCTPGRTGAGVKLMTQIQEDFSTHGTKDSRGLILTPSDRVAYCW